MYRGGGGSQAPHSQKCMVQSPIFQGQLIEKNYIENFLVWVLERVEKKTKKGKKMKFLFVLFETNFKV